MNQNKKIITGSKMLLTSMTQCVCVLFCFLFNVEFIYSQTKDPVIYSKTDQADIYFKIADSLQLKEQYDSARSFFFISGNIYKEVAEKMEKERTKGTTSYSDSVIKLQWEKYLDCQNKIGFVLAAYIGDFEEAIAVSNQADSIGINKLGINHIKLASIYDNLGIATYYYSGNYEKTKNYFLHSLSVKKIQADKLKNDTALIADIALSYTHIGTIYYEKGDFDSASVFYKKTILECTNAINQNKNSSVFLKNLSLAYNNMGLLYHKTGDYQKALNYHLQSLTIKLNIPGIPSSSIASNYNNIGILYDDLGDYEKALEYVQQSLRINLRSIGLTHLWIANDYNNMGSIYMSQNKFDKALENYELSIKYYSQSINNENPIWARVYNNIGTTYFHMKNYPKAKEYYLLALSYSKKETGPVDSETAASAYSNIGDIYNKLKDIPKTLESYNESFQIYQNAYGSCNPKVGLIYNKLGESYTVQAEYNKAISYYQKAIHALYKDFTDTNRYVNPIIPGHLSGKEDFKKFSENVSSKRYLLHTLIGKAEAFYLLSAFE